MKTTKIVRKEVEVEVLEKACCDNCNAELESPIYQNIEEVHFNSYQFNDALHIEFHGGYGMYFDDIDFDFIFCKTCADLLLEKFPCLKGILE